MTSNDQLILGIDVSTSCTGFAVINLDGKLIDASFVYLKEKHILEKAATIENRLKSIFENHTEISRIGIEQNMLGFRRGFSSAQVLSTLARFNGIVTYISFCISGIYPEMISVVNARKSLNISIPKGTNVKEKVIEWVKKEEPHFIFPQKTISSGKRKGQIVDEKGVEDACDAYVIARSLLINK